MRKAWVVLAVIFVGLLGSITAANYWLKQRMENQEARPSAPTNPQPSLLYPTRIQNRAEEAPKPSKGTPASVGSEPKGTQEKKIIYEFPLDDAILVQ